MTPEDQRLGARCHLFGPELCGPRKDPSDCDHSGPRGITFERAEDEPGRSPAPGHIPTERRTER